MLVLAASFALTSSTLAAPVPVRSTVPTASPSPTASPEPVAVIVEPPTAWFAPPTPAARPTPEATPKPKATTKPAPKPKPRRLSRGGWPIAHHRGYLSQRFTISHRGVDIAGDGGQRVVPMRSGRVLFAGWKNNCGGYQVWVSHGNGLYSAYYHLSREVTRAGARVTGLTTTIGYVGRTGCATGPHLHFEVWRGYPWRAGSRRVNPLLYIR